MRDIIGKNEQKNIRVRKALALAHGSDSEQKFQIIPSGNALL